MSDLPLVTIVTPSFNQGEFLEESILSVLNQDYPKSSTSSSTDATVDIMRKYEDRLAHCVSEKDDGQTHALVKGFEKAEGKYLGWLCSDDVLEPSMLSISVEYLERHSEVTCSYGDRARIDANGNIYSLQRWPEFRTWFLRYGLTLPQEITRFLRTAYDAVGGLDKLLHMAIDFDLWCKFSTRFRIRHIPALLGQFRAHGDNKSTQFSNQINVTGFGDGFPSEYAKVFSRHFGSRPSARRRALAKRLLPLLRQWDRRIPSWSSDAAMSHAIREKATT